MIRSYEFLSFIDHYMYMHVTVQNFVDWDYRKNVHKKASADYIGDKGFGESIVSVEASTYEDTVALSGQDVIFDLYAPWCILCARNKPLYEELAKRISKVSAFVLLHTDAKLL